MSLFRAFLRLIMITCVFSLVLLFFIYMGTPPLKAFQMLFSWQTVLLVSVPLGIYWGYKRMKESMQGSNLSWKAFLPIPIFRNKWRKEAVQYQGLLAKEGKLYSSKEKTIEERRHAFMEFIQDLPKYCIDDSIFSRMVRGALSAGGANFQQVVMHDASSISDPTVWIRKEQNYFLYNGGIYLYPWDYQKDVLHWDIQDCRPVYDRSPQVQWESPRMNSKYFYAIVNSVAMNKDGTGIESKMNILLILLGLLVIMELIGLYMGYSNQQATMKLMVNMSETINTRLP